MILLVSGATTTVRELACPSLGYLVVPKAQNTPIMLPLHPHRWACDNGAFSNFDAQAFLQMCYDFQSFPGCLFVTAPDVVGDAPTTLTLFEQWAPLIRRYGYPVALVAQDGLQVSQVPWSLLDALFIGGTTDWKLGTEARTLGAYAKARGKWLHLGRVNSRKRVHYGRRIGADSIDGSGFSRWPATRIPMGLRWMTEPLGAEAAACVSR